MDASLKQCSKCEKWKDVGEYKSFSIRYKKQCAMCAHCRRTCAEYSNRNKEKIHISRMCSKYNLTEEEYLKFKNENPYCSICGSVEKLCVDHDHTTGKVRGRLCHPCNAGIGNLKDSIPTLKSAITYLEKYSENKELVTVS